MSLKAQSIIHCAFCSAFWIFCNASLFADSSASFCIDKAFFLA